MKIEDFIKELANQFDETSEEELTPNCVIQELDEWSSISVMGIIAMAKTEFGKTITGKDIRSCETVEDLFNLIVSK